MRLTPLVAAGRANRAFLGRAVRYLASEAGVRQFLDIGTGIRPPTTPTRSRRPSAPETRIVYVDNDPVVLAHARALLTSTPEGATAYLDADQRDTGPDPGPGCADARPLPGRRHHAARGPAAMGDQDEPYRVVADLLAAVPPGSYLALSHVASDIEPDKQAEARNRLNKMVHEKQTHRSRDEVARFFQGLEIVEPGVVPVPQWRPDSDPEARRPSVMWGGVGRKR